MFTQQITGLRGRLLQSSNYIKQEGRGGRREQELFLVSQVERRRPRQKPVIIIRYLLYPLQERTAVCSAGVCRRYNCKSGEKKGNNGRFMIKISSSPASSPVVPLEFLCFNLVFTVYSQIGMTTAPRHTAWQAGLSDKALTAARTGK